SCAHGLTKSLSTRWPASASSLSRNACMRFVRDGKPAEDNFQRVADDVPIPENVPVLLSATRFLAEASALAGRPEPLGVLWPNNKDVEELAPHLGQVAVV